MEKMFTDTCSEKGLAPELYDILESVRGSWKAIIMELLPGTSLHSLHDTDLDNEKIRKIIDCLRNIKKTLQGSPYVHGDLRPNNLIVTSDFNVVKVVDFDWAGEESKVSYPLNLNTNDIAWASGVEPCRPITKKHDSWMLDCEIKTSSKRYYPLQTNVFMEIGISIIVMCLLTTCTCTQFTFVIVDYHNYNNYCVVFMRPVLFFLRSICTPPQKGDCM